MKVYIDGKCYLCSWEAKFIRRFDKTRQIQIVNIADPRFVAARRSDRRFETYLQVEMKGGHFKEGIDGLAEVYKSLSGWRWLGILLETPVIRQMAWGFYRVFARSRKFLPQRNACDL